MIVSVISPHATNNGNTITSILLALGLAGLKRKVFLTHTSPKSDAFYQYLGLKVYEDKTSTPTQLVKLMREGAIKPEEIPDYCKTVIDNLDVFTNNKDSFTGDDMETLLEYAFGINFFEYTVIDIDCYDANSTTIIKKSDIIILNVSQSFLELQKFAQQKDKIMKMCEGKKVILVCNKFSSVASKDKDIPLRMGVKAKCSVIHYNSWVNWGCNMGKIVDVYKFAKLKDPRVLELNGDISSLASLVAKAKIATSIAKKGGK